MTIEATASTPATSDRAVIFAVDGGYLPYALMAADQIARRHPARGFDICIAAMQDGLAVPASLAGHRIRVLRIATGGRLAGLNLDARRTESAYLRLALPAALAGSYRRLAYLDADVFVQGGDLAALLALDLGGHAVAAVRDNLQWRTPGRRPEQFRRLGLPSARYLNSGLLLIDVPRFNEAGVLERCLDFAAAHAGRMIGLDQELLNCVLHGDWAELSPVWNWQYTRASQLFEALEGAHIVHFIGAKKPWRHRSGELPLRFRQAYRSFLADHLPDAPQVGPDGTRPTANRAYLRRMLIRHATSVGAMADYLARFDSDLTVLT